MNALIFVCTANYFRSRYAEGLFNHLAEEVGLSWRATSRGIIADKVPTRGVSPHAVQALEQIGVAAGHLASDQTQLTERDLRDSARVVVLDRGEHLPMMFERFPRWYDMVDYWHVPDVDRCAPGKSLRILEQNVRDLVKTLLEADEPAP